MMLYQIKTNDDDVVVLAVKSNLSQPGYITVEIPVFDEATRYLGLRRYVDGALVVHIPDQEPDPVPDEISRRQFFQGLAKAGEISQDEALQAIPGAVLPGRIEAILSAIADAEARFDARCLLIGANTFRLSHPLARQIGHAVSMSDAQIEAFWLSCSKL